MFKWIKGIFNKGFTKTSNKLFGYLNKSDFLMVATTIPISLVSLSLQSISTHLDRKIERQKLLQDKPLNYLYVRFIPYEAYYAISTHQHWNKYSYMKDNNSALLSEERNVLPTNTFNEINEETNAGNQNNQTNRFILDAKDDSSLSTKVGNFGKQPSNTTNKYVDKIKQNNSADNKPPIQQTQQNEEVEYFIIQDSNGKTYDPNEVRRSGKKQNINYKKEKNGKYINTLNQNHKVVGKVGGKEIEHETLKETIVNIIYSALHIKKRKTYGVVFDTRYDAYGRLIKPIKQPQPSSNTISKRKENSAIHEEQNDKYMQKFILDGTLQQQVKSNSLQNINHIDIYTPNILKMLIKLEYLFENCWISYAKKYQNTDISYTYQVTYNKDTKKPVNVKFISKNIPNKMQHKTNEMKNDIKTTILNCDINNVDGLTERNYNFWKKIELTFTALKS